jgi:hypothetical protein
MPGETKEYQKQGVACLCIRGKWEYKWRKFKGPQLSVGVFQLSDGCTEAVNAGRQPFFPGL